MIVLHGSSLICQPACLPVFYYFLLYVYGKHIYECGVCAYNCLSCFNQTIRNLSVITLRHIALNFIGFYPRWRLILHARVYVYKYKLSVIATFQLFATKTTIICSLHVWDVILFFKNRVENLK